MGFVSGGSFVIVFARDEASADKLDRYLGEGDYYLREWNVVYWVGDGAQNDTEIQEGRAVLEDCFSE
jgi:hypothetical protein